MKSFVSLTVFGILLVSLVGANPRRDGERRGGRRCRDGADRPEKFNCENILEDTCYTSESDDFVTRAKFVELSGGDKCSDIIESFEDIPRRRSEAPKTLEQLCSSKNEGDEVNLCLVNKCYLKEIKSDLTRSERRDFKNVASFDEIDSEVNFEFDQAFKNICVICPAPNPEDNDIIEV